MIVSAPILMNHDHQSMPIGMVEFVDGRVQFRFASDARITREMAFNIFGNAGLVLEAFEEGGVQYIRRGRILEWSLVAAQPAIRAVG